MDDGDRYWKEGNGSVKHRIYEEHSLGLLSIESLSELKEVSSFLWILYS